MADTMIALSKILSGQSVYAGSELDVHTVGILEQLAKHGELIESHEGQSRWWQLRPNSVAYIKERSGRQ